MAKSSQKRRQRRNNPNGASPAKNVHFDALTSGSQSGRTSAELIPTAADQSLGLTDSKIHDANMPEGSYRANSNEIIQDSPFLPMKLPPHSQKNGNSHGHEHGASNGQYRLTDEELKIIHDRDTPLDSLKYLPNTKVDRDIAQIPPFPQPRVNGDINGQNGVNHEKPSGREQLVKDRILSWLPGQIDVMEFIIKQSSCRVPECPFLKDQIERGEEQETGIEDRRPRTAPPPRASAKNRLLQSLKLSLPYRFHAEHRNVRDLCFDPSLFGFHKKGVSTSHHFVTRFIIISPNLASMENGPVDFTFIFETVGLVGRYHCHHWGMIRLSAASAASLVLLITQCAPKRLKVGVGLREKQLIHRCATMRLDEFDGQAVFEELDTCIMESAEQAARKFAQEAVISSAPVALMLKAEAALLKLLRPTQRFHLPSGTFSTEFGQTSGTFQPTVNSCDDQANSPAWPKIKRRSATEPSLRKTVVVSEARKAAEDQAKRIEKNLCDLTEKFATAHKDVDTLTERFTTTSRALDALEERFRRTDEQLEENQRSLQEAKKSLRTRL